LNSVSSVDNTKIAPNCKQVCTCLDAAAGHSRCMVRLRSNAFSID